jgi:hypothetical protein
MRNSPSVAWGVGALLLMFGTIPAGTGEPHPSIVSRTIPQGPAVPMIGDGLAQVSGVVHLLENPFAGFASGLLAATLLPAHECALDSEALPLSFLLLNVTKFRPVDAISDVLVDKIVRVESGGRNEAKNPNSSALGQGQFIRSTWLAIVRKHKPNWAEGLTTAQILQRRRDRNASRWAIKAYAEENAPKLQRAGVGVDEASLYLAHMFDGPVAVKIYKADPSAAVKDIVGAAAFKSNRKLLAGKQVKDLIRWAQGKMRGSRRLARRQQGVEHNLERS